MFFLSCCSSQQESNKDFQNGSKIHINSCNPSEIENLTVLCKVWGYLKYYHPAVISGKYNWDFELFKIMPKIIKLKSRAERNQILYNWVKYLGNIDYEEAPEYINPDSVKTYPELSWTEDVKNLGIVSQVLQRIKTAKRNLKPLDYIEYPKNSYPTFRNEKSYGNISYTDAGYRLLTLFRYWNIIQYYYPYKYLLNDNWTNVLKNFIPQFIKVNSKLEYELVLIKLIAQIHDSHAQIIEGIDLDEIIGRNVVPVEITFVENKAVVTGFFNSISGNCPLKIGDIILSINGDNINSIVSKELDYTAASNYKTQLREIAERLLRTNKNHLYVKYKQDDNVKEDSLLCFPVKSLKMPSKFQRDKPLCQLIDNDVMYFYLGSSSGGTMPENIRAKGIIIDLRCYPSDEKINGYIDFIQLYPKPTAFAKFTLGSASMPGLFKYTNASYVGKVNPKYYSGKKIILVNELTQSHSEFMAMKYRVAPNSMVIGSTTAGADGGILKIILPTGISTTITGVGVYYPDGRETQRIGIVPDIEVEPTIKGIKNGRDEVLEKAIELIK